MAADPSERLAPEEFVVDKGMQCELAAAAKERYRATQAALHKDMARMEVRPAAVHMMPPGPLRPASGATGDVRQSARNQPERPTCRQACQRAPSAPQAPCPPHCLHPACIRCAPFTLSLRRRFCARASRTSACAPWRPRRVQSRGSRCVLDAAWCMPDHHGACLAKFAGALVRLGTHTSGHNRPLPLH
jgi:hypothetical protein